MTEEQQTLLMLKGTVASMAEDDRRRVEAAAADLREMVKIYGDHGIIALALVGAEMQAAD